MSTRTVLETSTPRPQSPTVESRPVDLRIHNVAKGSLDFRAESSPWLDLPRTDYRVLLAIDDPVIESLALLVSRYHSIEKSSLKTQSSRIAVLTEIGNHLEELSEQERFASQKSTILLLIKAVHSKKEYIQRILEIPSDQAIETYHSKCENPTHVTPLFLRNDSSYSLKMKEFWGKFWLESIDPCHRRLANYYHFWLDTEPACKDYQSFFLWMESQLIPKNIPVVEYYSDLKLQSCQIKIEDGYLRKFDTNELVNTHPTERTVYILDLAETLYVETWKEGVWHTSLSRGKPVLGAGLIKIVQGVLKMIAIESGHYLPPLEEGFQSVQILRKKHIRLKKSLEVVYFENRTKYRALVPMKNLTRYVDFYEALHVSTRTLVSSNEF